MRSVISFIIIVLAIIWLFEVQLNTCNCEYDVVFKYAEHKDADCKRVCEKVEEPWYTGILNTF